MNRFLSYLFIALILTAVPAVSYADPLCSDGTPAPGGNICNCGSAATLSGGSFVPGTGSGLSGNTYGGFQFSGVGGALASCLNIGSSISDAASSLFGGATGGTTSTSSAAGSAAAAAAGSGTQEGSTGSSVPTKDSSVQSNTGEIKKDTAKTTKREQCLNGAAYAVAKTALQKLSDKTLNWVKTGFNGNPFYVRDINSYLDSIKDEKLNNFVNNYVQSSDPIFGNALRSVIKQQATGYSDGFLSKVMNTPEGLAYQDFQNDFTQGGWEALLNMDNNPIGAYFDATDTLSNIVNTAQQNVRDELEQGNGFLSMKKCVEYAGTTPNAASGTHADGTSGDDDTAIHGSGDSTGPVTSTPRCIRYETVTPGSIISEQVANITNSTADQLLNADSINEVLGSFFDQLMNRLFSDGLTGAGRGSARSTTSGGFGTNVVTGSNGQTLASPTACQTPLGYNASTGGFNDEFDISRPQQLRKIIETQKSFLTRSQDAQYIMQSVVPRLGALDYCIPGPNPTWNNSLNENAETFVSQLQELRSRGNNSLVTLGGIISPLGGFGIICSIFSSSTNCNNDEHTVGWGTSRVSLFDKVDSNLKLISDRVYSTGAPQNYVANFFATVLDSLKAQMNSTYSEAAIVQAFVSASPAGSAGLITGDIKNSIKETANLVGYAQGVAAYNEQYNASIQITQNAITELVAIDQEVEAIVATAKARYIQEQAAAGTPVKLSCIDNAYQIGTVGPGLPHLQNITGTPDPMIQTSKDARTYFYTHL